MSQAKVDKYKDYKKNKKKILKREKAKAVAASIVGWGICILVVGALLFWAGYTAISSYQSYLASRPDYSRTEFVLGDLAGVLETEEETEEDADTEEDTDTEEDADEDTDADEDSETDAEATE